MSDIAAEVVSGSPAGDIQSDSVESFSFEDAHQKALAMWEGGTQSPQATEQPTEPAEAVADAGAADATNVDNASGAQLAQLNDNDLVEVTVDGEQVTMPWKDAKGGVMRQAHYTRSMQQLRQEQQQFESGRAQAVEAAQQRDALVELLRSEELMQQFLQKQYPHLARQGQALEQAQQATDPNDIATVGQLQELQAQHQAHTQALLQEFRKELGNELERSTYELETRQETAKLANSVNATIADIFKSHPEIEALIPNADQNLRFEVLQLAPKTAAETLDAFKQVAAGWVEKISAHQAAQKKQEVISKNKLVKNNIQGPGGTQVTPQPTNFKKVNRMTGKTEVDWSALHSVAMGVLDKK